MEKQPFRVIGFILIAMAMIVFSGCEIAKGASKDLDRADQWVRDVAW